MSDGRIGNQLGGIFLRGSFAALSAAWTAVGGAVGVALMPLLGGWLPLSVSIAIGAYVALYVAYHNADVSSSRSLSVPARCGRRFGSAVRCITSACIFRFHGRAFRTVFAHR